MKIKTKPNSFIVTSIAFIFKNRSGFEYKIKLSLHFKKVKCSDVQYLFL